MWSQVEFMPDGNLRDFLRKCRAMTGSAESRHVSAKEMLTYLCDVAKGMEFIASKRFVHR
jgi:hypothetical protein